LYTDTAYSAGHADYPKQREQIMMNPTERQELRQEIDRQIAEVRAEIEALGESASPVAPDNAIGRVSRMDAINNHAINEGSLGRARERLEQLESALARIDQPDFGTCVMCRQPIAPARLAYLPDSTLCVQCASR
jgi:DnaK suppressor protein